MLLARFLLILGFLLLILLLIFRETLGIKLPEIKGLFTNLPTLSKDLNLPNIPDNLKPQIPDLASGLPRIASSAANLIKSPPDLDTLTGLTQNVPQELQKNLPTILEIFTGSRKEELYFISPKNLILPQVETKDYEQEIKAQLFGFEVKDTRRSSRSWQLRIYVKESSLNGSSTKMSDLNFKLPKEQIEPITALGEELAVEEGSDLKIRAKPGRGKGLYKFNPTVIIKIPAQSRPPAKLEIETEFD